MSTTRRSSSGSRKLTPIAEEEEMAELMKAALKAERKAKKEIKRREMEQDAINFLRSNAKNASEKKMNDDTGVNLLNMLNAERRRRGLSPIKGGKRKTRRKSRRHRRKTFNRKSL
jgi:hypothetical protein